MCLRPLPDLLVAMVLSPPTHPFTSGNPPKGFRCPSKGTCHGASLSLITAQRFGAPPALNSLSQVPGRVEKEALTWGPCGSQHHHTGLWAPAQASFCDKGQCGLPCRADEQVKRSELLGSCRCLDTITSSSLLPKRGRRRLQTAVILFTGPLSSSDGSAGAQPMGLYTPAAPSFLGKAHELNYHMWH